jgi:peroxidase
LKIGDRFFYDLGLDQSTQFSAAQLQELRKSSMSRVLCDNTDRVEDMQPQAFKMAGSSSVNLQTSCKDKIAIPDMNLHVFSEGL